MKGHLPFAGLFVSALMFASVLATPEIDRNIYYSVGTRTSPLYSENASASKGVMVLASPASNIVGVGDEVRQGSNHFYIRRRDSQTVFRIQNSATNSGTPGDTNITFTSQSIYIYRAFNSLDSALHVNRAGSSNRASDANHLNDANLADSSSYTLHIPCYGDGADGIMTTVDGWTTGPNNYIRIYTPTSANEVGAPQRHDGKWNTNRYRLRAGNGGDDGILEIYSKYVRVDGLQVEILPHANSTCAISSWITTGNAEIWVSNSICKNADTDNNWGLLAFSGDNANTVIRAWNNILIDTLKTAVGLSHSGGTAYFNNNTVYNCNYGGWTNGNGTRTLKNNLFQSYNALFSGTFTEDYSVTSGTGATGTHSRNSKNAIFVNAGAGDFHLAATDTAAKDYGLDLSTTQSFTMDVDGFTRGGLWDVGADEATEAGYWQSVGTDIFSLNAGNVGIGTTSPQAKLDVAGSINVSGLSITKPFPNEPEWLLTAVGTSGSSGGILAVRAPDGPSSGTTTGGNLYLSGGRSYVDSGWVGRSAVIVESGLEVTGIATAQAFKVGDWTLTAPDFVFEPDYKLMSLKEIEKFIEKNKHLPGIPSAAEMKKDGVDLAQMNMDLLKKVEELTLHVIKQQKEIEKLNTK